MEPPAQFLDAKSYIEHDPLIGYRYSPNFKQTLPRPGGGHYEIAINSQGIRSSRDYSFQKPPGVYRILVFGDSYAAGQYVSNEQRFSEILERRIPNLEVINFALEGTGTDQQLLIFENIGRQYQFDLVMLFPFLQNIRRNMVESRESYDPKTKEKILLPKPRFELVEDKLVLSNVPVPDKHVSEGRDQSDRFRKTDVDLSLRAKLKTAFSRYSFFRRVKRLTSSIVPWEPFPEYRDANAKPWRLMEAIIRRFKEAAGSKPIVIVPVFYASYVQWRIARNYWNRFTSLTSIRGTHVIDLLPHFRRLGVDAPRCFLEPHDCHFSAQGHLAVAGAIELELRRMVLLPSV